MASVIFVCLCASLWNVCHTESVEDSLQEVSRSNREFTRSFYKAIARTKQGTDSIVFSPLSVQVMLAMSYLGAGGETAKQLSRGLGLPNRPDLFKSGFRELLKTLPSSDNCTLETANKMFPALNYTVMKTFSDTVQEFFFSDIENVDYKQPSKAAATINSWVNKKTHGMITDIVAKNSLTSAMAMVLVNAVYFKGVWKKAFLKQFTNKAPFFVNGKYEKQVDMMHLSESLNYQENKDIGAKFVHLPYTDESIELVIVLPVARDGLSSVEAKLGKTDLMKVLEWSREKQVILSLPKFRLKQISTLGDELHRLGMANMFDATANFSKMTSEFGLHVSRVMHEARFEVDEMGTVASAATKMDNVADVALQMEFVAMFVVDHPFVFALISKRLGVVLFAGRYTGVERNEKNALTGYRSHRARGDEEKGGTASYSIATDLWLLAIVFSLQL